MINKIQITLARKIIYNQKKNLEKKITRKLN